MLDYVLLALGAGMTLGGWFWRKSVLTAPPAEESAGKKRKKVLWPTVLFLAGIWTLAEKLLQLIFGSVPAEEFTVDIWAERISLGGVTISATVLVTWAIVAVVAVLAVAIRVLVVPRMTDEPKGVQNVLELIVETVCNFTHSSVGDLGDCLSSYIFTVGVLMVSCAAVELLGVRAPTSDITMTFSMALVTFVLINYLCSLTTTASRKRVLPAGFRPWQSPPRWFSPSRWSPTWRCLYLWPAVCSATCWAA